MGKETKRRYKKYNIFDENINRVPIYESEIQTIAKQDSNELQRLLFVILVWSKFSRYKNTICDDKEIASIAGVHGVKRDIGIIIQDVLSEDDWTDDYLLQYEKYRRKTAVYRVLFVEKDESKKPIFWVDNIEDCKDLFHKHFRDGLYCQRCDTRIENPTGRNQKYCCECSKEVRREKVALNVKKFRKRKNSEKKMTM